MSDFINRLIKRHRDAGEKVLPKSHSLFETNVETISLPLEEHGITNLGGLDQGSEQNVSKQIERGSALTQTGNPKVNSSAMFASHEAGTGTMPTLVSPVHHKPFTTDDGEKAHSFSESGDLSISGGTGKNPPVIEFSFCSAMNPPGHGAGKSGTGGNAYQGTLSTPETVVSPMSEMTQMTHVKQGGQVMPILPAWIKSWERKPSKEATFNDTHSGANRVINVSIGRIEVRATRLAPEPPAQRKKTTAGAGIMTLEQYLNRRSKGGNP